ncbi:glutamate/gamma-aminobutyrate family transporter YjeM [Entomospira nematocerorum]|uniref:Glutamate/gamma-aminobutyrate family transporter YjeM n=1 Tax=Entomospira nematocerorum TaxID=2719987 RepID=A0A968GDE3_9SPIO|nr:glutamate/gamma-aminobutyrate family transporter YjeM [Entomospira nematocera]NIZ47408.1 glutamate/gamma-aminobutyrate family transporter YjeM [Entomospira nematocera]WDI34053.1 glutamate/gamma-aminobutyrate family transporter YjeM [Entomospira nematocera]
MSQKENILSNKISLMSFILMLFTSVFGFNNASRGFYNMGYAAIPWYILAAIGYGIPFAIMVAEMASAFKNEKGGFYSWLEPVISKKLAFIGMFMWYSGYVIWMISVSSSGLWISFTTFLFGSDKTSQFNIPFLQLQYNQILNIIAILWMLAITAISARGLRSISAFARIGGYAVWTLNIVLILGGFILFIIQKGTIQFTLQGENTNLFLHSPNPNYQTLITMMSFLVYALFAFGGMETASGLVDKIQNPEKRFPKGLLTSAIVIAVGYSAAIFSIGVFTDWYDLHANPLVNLGNVTYFILQNLGITIGNTLGLSGEGATQLGIFFARFTGLGLFLSLMGAFFTLIYAPLKQLIEGTPATIWPQFMLKQKNGIPVNALWVQASFVILLLLVNSIGGKNAEEFIKFLTEASNVALTLPYVFISIAYWFFIKNTAIHKPFRIIKSDRVALSASLLVTAILLFANFFAIFQPTLSAIFNPIGFENELKDAMQTSLTYIAGPLIFTVIALILFHNGEKRNRQTH